MTASERPVRPDQVDDGQRGAGPLDAGPLDAGRRGSGPSATGPLAGRRALVTGASRGIGRAVAERLAADGADVAVTARTEQPGQSTLAGTLADTAALVRAHGRRCAVVAADLADPAARAAIVPAAAERLGGPIDILVNNAAAAIYQPLTDFPLSRRHLTFEVNVHAPLDLAQQVIGPMRAAGAGWIVNISSSASRHNTISAGRHPRPEDGSGPVFAGPRPAMGVYGASKAALDRLTTALAVELWGSGIRVNALAPRAAVRTEGTDVLVGALPADQLEPLEAMVGAVAYLCRCPEAESGGVLVSLDLIEQHGLRIGGTGG